MRPRDVIELLLLSVLWGGAYLFTRSAVPAFGPAPPLVILRFGIAATMLLAIVRTRGGFAPLRRRLGALHIAAGVLAVPMATAPMVAARVARCVLGVRLGAWRAAGLAIGFAGVLGLMASGGVSLNASDGVLAVLALLGGALTWSVGANYTLPLSMSCCSRRTSSSSSMKRCPNGVSR